MRRILLTVLAVLGTTILYSGAVGSTPSIEEMRAMVEANGKVFSEGVRNHDFERIAALYTENAKYGKDDEDFVLGRAAIRQDWKQFVSSGEFTDLILETMTIQGNHSIIYETGRGRTTFRDEKKPPYKFKYVNVWVRQADGSYKLDVDFYNGLP
jgi:ketosteroid isomerase-like protein